MLTNRTLSEFKTFSESFTKLNGNAAYTLKHSPQRKGFTTKYDVSARFAALAAMGAFFDATSEHIFEEPGKGILASL